MHGLVYIVHAETAQYIVLGLVNIVHAEMAQNIVLGLVKMPTSINIGLHRAC